MPDTERRGRRGGRALTIGALVAGAVLMVLPLLWWLSFAMSDSAALRPDRGLWGTWVPTDPQPFANLREALGLYPLDRFFVNSIAVAAAVSVSEVLLSALAGFAFAKLRFPGRGLLFGALVALAMVPQLVIVIPLFELAVDAGLTDSYTGLVVPFLVTPLGVFMMRQFIGDIPDSYLEAARMEGAGELRTFLLVVLPLSRNGLLSLGLFTFLLQWDSLLWPLVATSDERYFTLPVGIALMQTNVTVPYNAIYASTLAFSLPLLVLYALLQRRFMRSLAFGGLAG